jgi:formate hydrogenlyase subunit 3/multisubunit Na+/H+ antiporter MnhD subunit
MGFTKLFFTNSILVPFVVLIGALSTSYANNLYFLLEWSQLPTIIWYSGVILALLSVWALSQRITVSRLQYIVYLMFLPLVGLFVSTKNLLVFFMCYELFLLPSFIIVFFGSPNRRGILASIYFLM